ncbi:MAG: transposase [Gammaproteobacteria bacterium]
MGDLLSRWPSLQALQKAAAATLRKFFHAHNCRSEERIRQRLDRIRQAVPATTDPALLETAALCIQNSIRVLAQLRTGIAAFDRSIAQTYRAHPDRAIMEFPGAGQALEPRLLAAAGSLRDRFESAHSLACYSGIAPVKVSSGNSCWIHWRWACPKFIRQTFHEWAGCSIRCCDWARTFYEHQRANHKGHPAAVRALTYKWIRIFFRCWRDHLPYSADRYQKALQAKSALPAESAANVSQPHANPLGVSWISCGGFSKLVKNS